MRWSMPKLQHILWAGHESEQEKKNNKLKDSREDNSMTPTFEFLRKKEVL